jgi:hypothetical protein
VFLYYLEYGECLPVCDAFESLAVDGEDPVAFLDAAIPVGHTPANHFMNLREHTKHKKREKKKKKMMMMMTKKKNNKVVKTKKSSEK